MRYFKSVPHPTSRVAVEVDKVIFYQWNDSSWVELKRFERPESFYVDHPCWTEIDNSAFTSPLSTPVVEVIKSTKAPAVEK